MNLQLEVHELYRGWAGMGLHLQGVQPRTVYPEALVIGLATIGRYDQRLFDEALSFLKTHPRIIRSNYFKVWSRHLKEEDKACLRVILEVCGIKHSIPKPEAPSSCIPLFLHEDRSDYTGKNIDTEFESKGFLRNTFKLSNMTPTLSLSSKSNPWLKMRLTAGIMAQSDLLTIAVNAPKLTAPMASEILGLTTKSSWTILQDLCTADWMKKTVIGRKDHYTPTPNFLKKFSYLKFPKIKVTPISWIESAERLSWIKPKNASKEYQQMWLKKKEEELLGFSAMRNRIEQYWRDCL